MKPAPEGERAPSTPRVDQLRSARKAAGLKRRELYVHDEDWPKVQALAAKLQAKRDRSAR